MEESRYLYVMISHTGTGIGRAIRYWTGFDYNHVSLSLDPTFNRWVSFARYARNVPLAGGFVAEDPDRFLSDCADVPVRIFRLEISEARFRLLTKIFSEAGASGFGLIYNSFGALAASFGASFPVAGAYTCLEFANVVLGENSTSIEQLNDRLLSHMIFDGQLLELVSPSGSWESDYFLHRSFSAAAFQTLLHFMKLLRNTVYPDNQPDPFFSRLRFH